MSELFQVGQIVKPQGIKGEVKVRPFTDDLTRFNKLKEVIIDGVTHKITGVKYGAGFLFVSIFGVTDRNQAETFRNKFICVKRGDLPEIEEGNYYIADIIDCKLVTDLGEEIGVVKDVTSARTDIFTVECQNGKTLRFPFLKDLLCSVDISAKTITVKSKRLSEVGLYED